MGGADVDMEDELGRAITGDVEPEAIGEATGTWAETGDDLEIQGENVVY